MTVTITIPNIERDVICSNEGYQATVNAQPNPQTKEDFVKERLKMLLGNIVKGGYRNIEAKKMDDALKLKAEPDITVS